MAGLLRCRDLRAGDILLKVSDGSILSRAIELGQTATGGRNAGVVHAGVMFDSTYIIEAQAAGISANDLRVQNRSYGYYAFRCNRQNMAQGAGTCAKMMFDIHKTSGSLRYSVLGAVGVLAQQCALPETGAEFREGAFEELIQMRARSGGAPKRSSVTCSERVQGNQNDARQAAQTIHAIGRSVGEDTDGAPEPFLRRVSVVRVY